jgi:hypothetical protein
LNLDLFQFLARIIKSQAVAAHAAVLEGKLCVLDHELVGEELLPS